MIPPSLPLNPGDPDLPAQVAAIPNVQGIYLLSPANGIPYLGQSAYLRKRLARLLLGCNSFTTLRASLIKIEYWLTASRLETSLLLYWLAREHQPETYRKRLKLRDPWFVSLVAGDGFARLAVRSRIARQSLPAYGPFPDRESAERMQQGVLSLFQIRRCDEKLEPSEHHPGCIYGEMNLCMRPCQLAASEEEYAAEVSRLTEFVRTNGNHALSNLMAARDRASEEMDFEQAARLHKDLEKVKSVAALRGELIAEIESLNGVALTKAAGASCVALWPMVSGYWQPPLFFDFGAGLSPSHSLDRQLKERLSEHLSATRQDGNRAEEVSLLSRWFYSSWRDGDWFPFKELAHLNYRKLVRRISSLVREGSKHEA